MEECCLFVLLACLSSGPAATIADWQVVKMSLCAYQKVGTLGWTALLPIGFEAAIEIRFLQLQKQLTAYMGFTV